MHVRPIWGPLLWHAIQRRLGSFHKYAEWPRAGPWHLGAQCHAARQWRVTRQRRDKAAPAGDRGQRSAGITGLSQHTALRCAQITRNLPLFCQIYEKLTRNSVKFTHPPATRCIHVSRSVIVDSPVQWILLIVLFEQFSAPFTHSISYQVDLSSSLKFSQSLNNCPSFLVTWLVSKCLFCAGVMVSVFTCQLLSPHWAAVFLPRTDQTDWAGAWPARFSPGCRTGLTIKTAEVPSRISDVGPSSA